MSWQPRFIDPTAGVTLVRRVICPRCGFDKGDPRGARRGLCHDCRAGLAPAERREWAA